MSKKEREAFESSLKNRMTEFPKHLSYAKYSKIDKTSCEVLSRYYSPAVTNIKCTKTGLQMDEYSIFNPFNWRANETEFNKGMKIVGATEDFKLTGKKGPYNFLFSKQFEKKSEHETNMVSAIVVDRFMNLHRRSLNNLFIESNDLYDSLLLADISRISIDDAFMNKVLKNQKYEECSWYEFSNYSFLGKFGEITNSAEIQLGDRVRFRNGFIHVPFEKNKESISWFVISFVDDDDPENEHDFHFVTCASSTDKDNGYLLYALSTSTKPLSIKEAFSVNKNYVKTEEFMANLSNETTDLENICKKCGHAGSRFLMQLWCNAMIYQESQTDYVMHNIPLKESKAWLKNTIYLGINEEFICKPSSDKRAHYRCGYFKMCESDFYVNKRGQYIWVRPTYVHRELISGNRKLSESCVTLEEA